MTKGVVTFWIREKLQTKITDLIHQSLATQSLSPGIASKLYGMANFFEMGVYGRVGCGGLAAIKARQYERTTIVTPAIHTCFEVLRAVIRSQPRREFEVTSPTCSVLCCFGRCLGGTKGRLRRLPPCLVWTLT